MKINDFKAKFIEKCKTPTIRIMIFIILICSISVAYLFINRIKPDFKTIPNTFTIYDGKDIKLKANYKLNGKVTYDVHNLTSNEVYTGVSCFLQKKNMGNWETLIPNKSISSILVCDIISSNESKEYSSDLVFVYGNLPIGKYRIVKEVEMNGKDIYVVGKFRILVPGLKQQITKKEAPQVVQEQYYNRVPNSNVHIDDFDNTIIEKVTYEGKRVYKVTFQSKHGEWLDSEVWYVDKSGRIVGQE